MKYIFLSLVSAFSLVGCASSSEVDQQRRQLAELNQRSLTLESRLSNERLLDMLNHVEQLKQDIATLRGQLDVTQHTLQTLQKRQNDLYTDLDQRLSPLEEGRAPTPKASATAASVQNAYSAALDQLRARQFKQAIPALKAVIDQHPNTPQGIEAQYWLGVAYSAEQQWQPAITVHQRFIDTYTEHARVPEAMRILGDNLQHAGQTTAGQAVWKKLLRRFPKSEAAAKVRPLMK